MRILLTNDDGYDAPGMTALCRAVGGWDGVELEVIAPAQVQSGVGHATTNQFCCRPCGVDGERAALAVEGTPVDCVRASVVLPGRSRPDWVISGINNGGNLGVDVYRSGTVAAAREAALLGIPAIAISQFVNDLSSNAVDWATVVGRASAVLAAIIRPDANVPANANRRIFADTRQAIGHLTGDTADMKPAPCWNINLPRCAADAEIRVELTPISNDPSEITYEHIVAEDGSCQLRYIGEYLQRPATPGTDVAVLFAGYITISQLLL